MAHQSTETGVPLTVLAEDEQLFYASVLEFADERIRPLVREMDEHAKVPRALVDQLFELGAMGIEIPDAYGGQGGSFFHAVLAVEALSEVDPSVGLIVDVQNTLVANAILRWGSADVKRRYLGPLSTRTVGAYALSEAGSGSDAFALSTRAVPRGDGFSLTGRKLWITNANEADLFIVFATIDPSAGYRGITAFLVERGFAGFEVGRNKYESLEPACRGLGGDGVRQVSRRRTAHRVEAEFARLAQRYGHHAVLKRERGIVHRVVLNVELAHSQCLRQSRRGEQRRETRVPAHARFALQGQQFAVAPHIGRA